MNAQERTLLNSIQDLQRRLLQMRTDSETSAAAAAARTAPAPPAAARAGTAAQRASQAQPQTTAAATGGRLRSGGKLIIVANRLPLTMDKDKETGKITVSRNPCEAHNGTAASAPLPLLPRLR